MRSVGDVPVGGEGLDPPDDGDVGALVGGRLSTAAVMSRAITKRTMLRRWMSDSFMLTFRTDVNGFKIIVVVDSCRVFASKKQLDMLQRLMGFLLPIAVK